MYDVSEDSPIPLSRAVFNRADQTVFPQSREIRLWPCPRSLLRKAADLTPVCVRPEGPGRLLGARLNPPMFQVHTARGTGID